ncbi:hypothetical protein DFR74_115164 [Nocardia puris]|uniref:Uncharacterized protein n=2 Tax=Nocardia puris TaxID=208602 RepID=A0A366D5T0_9NOCA|nr:hypothetical protein DFR74_115164 [Nocardia puris]
MHSNMNHSEPTVTAAAMNAGHTEWPGWKVRLLRTYYDTARHVGIVLVDRYPEPTREDATRGAFGDWMAELNVATLTLERLRRHGCAVGIPATDLNRAEDDGLKRRVWEAPRAPDSLRRAAVVDEIARDIWVMTQMAALAAEHRVDPFPAGGSRIGEALVTNARRVWMSVYRTMDEWGLTGAERDSLWSRDGTGWAATVEVLSMSGRAERQAAWTTYSHPELLGLAAPPDELTGPSRESEAVLAMIEQASDAWRRAGGEPGHTEALTSPLTTASGPVPAADLDASTPDHHSSGPGRDTAEFERPTPGRWSSEP